MQLTLFTDYSLRSLVYIALKTWDKGNLTTIKDISSDLRISNNHVVKVIHNLSRSGFIETLRGSHGGIRLARSPSEINLGDVVSATENFSCVLHCVHTECTFHQVCLFQGIMRRAATAFIKELSQNTLADLVSERDRLLSALETAPASAEQEGELCCLLTVGDDPGTAEGAAESTVSGQG